MKIKVNGGIYEVTEKEYKSFYKRHGAVPYDEEKVRDALKEKGAKTWENLKGKPVPAGTAPMFQAKPTKKELVEKKKQEDEEGNDTRKEELSEMKNADLEDLLVEMGVDVPNNANKATLVDLIIENE